MNCKIKNVTTKSVATLLVLCVLNAASAFAQQASAPSSPDVGNATRNSDHGKHRGKKEFFLGICVGQALATANPPIVFQKGQMQSNEVRAAVKAAKQMCRSAFLSSRHDSKRGNYLLN